MSLHPSCARIAAILAALVLSSGAARAADVHVDATAGDDRNDGSSWALAVRSLGRAMVISRAAVGPERILVAAGTYRENVELDQVGTQLLGGHPTGGGTRDPAANPTIIDGGAIGPALFVSANGGNDVIEGITVDGFTFRNGKQLGRPDILGAGGGVFIEEAQVMLTNNVFTANVSDGVGLFGAGLYVYRYLARPSTITGNRFEGNEARNGAGGAIAILDFQDPQRSTPIELSGNEIRNNRAVSLPGVDPSAYSGAGGGIFAWKGKPRITNNLITGNVAETQNDVAYTGQGGGIFVIDSAPILTGNTISSNVVRALGGQFGGSGGGMYGWWSTFTRAGSVPLVMTGNTIANNRAEGGTGEKQAAGGGVALGIVGDSTPTLTDNVITGNVAVGGGRFSAQGGGVFVYMRETGPAYLTISGGEIRNNQAESGGGGLWLQGGRTRRLALADTIVADNEADYGSGLMLFGDGIARNVRIRGNRVYDPDGDQVSEISDNCKGLANGVQSDADGDTVGDACDDDDDDDGVADASDPCPLVAGASCAGDADGDTVGDATDNCPLVANLSQSDATLDGVGDACEPAAFDALETDAGGVWVYGDSTLTNVEIVDNVGQGLVIAGNPTDPAGENPASPTITNATISNNLAAGIITYLADGTTIKESIIARNVLSDGFDTERTGGGGIPSSPNVRCDDVYFYDGISSMPCTGTGNMDFTDGDTYFAAGPLGQYYLAQAAAGQANQFVGVDAGAVSASASDVSGLTTRTDGVADSGNVDIGFHYPRSSVVIPPDSLTSSVRVTKPGSDLSLSLFGAPPGISTVRWYRGEIGALPVEYSHSTPFTGLPALPECGSAPSVPVSDAAARDDGNDWYYLAVVVEAGVESAFGSSSMGVPRPGPDDDTGDRVTNGCP